VVFSIVQWSGWRRVRSKEALTAFLLVAIFGLTRWLFWLAGVRYDASSLPWFWQYLDIPILKHDLLRGCLYMHGQPPLFNIFLGVILKVFPDSANAAFHVAYLGCGLLIYWGLYRLLYLAGVRIAFALLAATAFVISPGSILFENWLFYAYPISALLVLAALAMRHYEISGRLRWAVVFLFLIAAVCLTRPAFHLVFYLFWMVFLVVWSRRPRLKLALAGTAIGSLVLAVYLKNLVLFGTFAASSWSGMNFYRIVGYAVGPRTVNTLVEQGAVPRVAAVKPFSALEKYPEEYRSAAPCRDLPLLTETRKSTGFSSLHHCAYIGISEQYAQACRILTRRYRKEYAAAIFDAGLVFCQPSWECVFLSATNLQAVAPYIQRLSKVRLQSPVNIQGWRERVFGVLRPSKPYPLSSLLFIPGIILMAMLTTAARAAAAWRDPAVPALANLFMTLTILYVAVLGNCMEYGENNRFRVEVDPLLFCMAVLSLRDIGQLTGRLWRRHGARPTRHPPTVVLMQETH